MNEAFEWRDAPAADFAVIGDPVAHSRSPQMHQAAYDALGLSYRYVPIRVTAGDVGAALDHLGSLGYRGVNVTVPHKAEAMAWAREPDEVARRIGVSNTLSLIDGRATNTDGAGFLDTLWELGVLPNARVEILGAGGTARALAAVLPDAGFQVSIWNRTELRAIGLAREFGLKHLAAPGLDFDVMVNTTSAGLQDAALPVDWDGAHPGTIAYDLVYKETRFLSEAASRGLRTVDGKALLVAQGARSFEWWLGIAPPREVMLKAIQ